MNTRPRDTGRKEHKMIMLIPYYPIDEKTARLSHDMMSMRDYKEGSTTAGYKAQVDAAAAIAAQQKERKPEYAQAIDALLDRYARKLAEWVNTESRIGTMCPSILIAGGDGLSERKKARQNARYDAHHKKLAEIEAILHRIKTIGTGGIQAGDENALVKLENKLADLKEMQELMKAVNAYYRKEKTLDGCDLLTFELREKIKASMASSFRSSPVPFESFSLSNNNAEIHRIEKRIKEIQEAKDRGDMQTTIDGVEGVTLVEDSHLMRIKLVFDGKPEPEIRDILKANGFKWAPSQQAWQRNLNESGRSAARRVIAALREMEAEA